MGEAKRRRNLGLPPRKKNTNIKADKVSFTNKILSKYPYFPYILGFSVITILIIDLINYYR